MILTPISNYSCQNITFNINTINFINNNNLQLLLSFLNRIAIKNFFQLYCSNFFLIYLGDILISVDGSTVRNLSFVQQVELIRKKSRPLVLEFIPSTRKEN